MVVLFGEVHEGDAALHDKGVLQLFKHISDCQSPVDVFLEQPECSGKHLRERGRGGTWVAQFAQCTRGLLLADMLEHAVHEHNARGGCKFRLHYADARDVVENTGDVFALKSKSVEMEKHFKAAYPHLESRGRRLSHVVPELASRISQLEALTIEALKQDALSADGVSFLSQSWMNVSVVQKMLMRSTNPTVVGYFGNAHVWKPSARDHPWQIVSLLRMAGFETLASSSDCP
jgi:hypothetical protein